MAGVGSAAHLTSELLKQTGGVSMEHIPYKGTAPALQALMGGEIQVLIDVPSSVFGSGAVLQVACPSKKSRLLRIRL